MLLELDILPGLVLKVRISTLLVVFPLRVENHSTPLKFMMLSPINGLLLKRPFQLVSKVLLPFTVLMVKDFSLLVVLLELMSTLLPQMLSDLSQELNSMDTKMKELLPFKPRDTNHSPFLEEMMTKSSLLEVPKNKSLMSLITKLWTLWKALNSKRSRTQYLKTWITLPMILLFSLVQDVKKINP